MRVHRLVAFALLLAALLLIVTPLPAHNVAAKDAEFLKQSQGAQIVPFIYLGAKHMVTGYDHLLFLFGVIFFLYRLRDVAVYVTCFAVGHSITLLSGVLTGINLNPYIVDAIIGLSVVYKAFDNLDGFRTWFGLQPNTKLTVLAFGLVHGFGLATKLQELNLSPLGLVGNMLSFNLGVELGQIVALSVILMAMTWWRGTSDFVKHAVAANVVVMTLGFVLMGYQIAGYMTEKAG
ncbi:MAG: HupE/UreJ family protein [Bryobacterales bacterium]|nr:HupE/UreJ family protein [Bryobacterales bacterium]